jgi:hypothetical protein
MKREYYDKLCHNNPYWKKDVLSLVKKELPVFFAKKSAKAAWAKGGASGDGL